jgi:hypothetical protein
MARMDKSLVALLKRFDDLHAKKVGDGKKEDKKQDTKNDDDKDEAFDGGWDAYGGDTKVDNLDRRRLHRNRRGTRGNRPRDLHGHDDVFSKIKTVMKSTFIWIRTHVHICLVASAIIKSLSGGLSVQGVAPPYFGPMGRVSSWVR